MTYIDINDPSVRNVGVGEAPRWPAKPIRLLLISISIILNILLTIHLLTLQTEHQLMDQHQKYRCCF